MDAEKLVKLRKQAEKAVEGMSDGDLKVKAFEVILAHLMSGNEQSPRAARPSLRTVTGASAEEPVRGKGRERVQKGTASGRILVTRDEGFFGTQRTIGQVREELAAHGWHYPVTSLSGTLQSLVRQHELRRVRVSEGKKKVWKYSNY